MATTYDVLLLNGPCDQTTKTLTQAQLDSGTTTCKNTTYNRAKSYSTPEFKYVFVQAGTKPNQGGGSTSIHAPQAMKGWKAIQTSAGPNLRAALNHSEAQTRAALRTLARSRKVPL